MAYRTDLAVELLENLRGRDEFSGVSEREYEREGLYIHEAEVTTERSRAAARKALRPLSYPVARGAFAARGGGVSAQRAACSPHSSKRCCRRWTAPLPVLIAGLGSRSITPDAVGPHSADHVIATRHLISRSPDIFASWRPVSVLAPGVLGQTGVETGEIVRGVLDHVRPRCGHRHRRARGRPAVSRLVRTVQLADTGIVPGSGVNNARAALDEADARRSGGVHRRAHGRGRRLARP
ncbi:MAG: GPR endopeptidase [Butyricicoccaceae bacterium]